MFRQCLRIWLIISILGYGSAWAFDSHPDETAGHQRAATDISQATDGDEDHPACDHCCHISAHTIALSPYQTGMSHPGTCTGHTPYRETLSSLATTPPEHPPRS